METKFNYYEDYYVVEITGQFCIEHNIIDFWKSLHENGIVQTVYEGIGLVNKNNKYMYKTSVILYKGLYYFVHIQNNKQHFVEDLAMLNIHVREEDITILKGALNERNSSS